MLDRRQPPPHPDAGVSELIRAIVDLAHGLNAVSEMHDRLIVATALHLARDGTAPPLLTRDADITSANVVPVIW